MEEKVEKYVRENYKKLYGEQPLIITEIGDNLIAVQVRKDESPLFLNKSLFM